MTSFYGDLVIVDIAPEEILASDAENIKRTLVGLERFAVQVEGPTQFDALQCLGMQYNNRLISASGTAPGTSMDYAYLAGIGIFRDHLLYAKIPEFLNRALEHESAHERRLAELRIASLEAGVNQRKPELTLLSNIVAKANEDSHHQSIKLLESIETNWLCSFEEAWLRRQAYCLAFEPSLRQKSLRPYQRYFEQLFFASSGELERVCPKVTDSAAFPIYLNLTGYLYAADFSARKFGNISDGYPGEPVDVDNKVRFLKRALDLSVAVSRASLPEHRGNLLSALTAELEYRRQQDTIFFPEPANWGCGHVSVYEELSRQAGGQK